MTKSQLPDSEAPSGSSPSMWQVAKAVLASAFGVQSQHNLKLDFQSQSFVPYLFIGVIFLIAFVLGLVGIVSLIL